MLINTKCVFITHIVDDEDFLKFVFFYKKLRTTISNDECIQVQLSVEKSNETPKEKQETTQD